MRAIADCAASLGSRFNLIFDPESRRVYQNTYGRFPGRPLQLGIAVELPDGREVSLPFRDAEEYFERVEYFPSLTGFIYRGIRPDLGLELSLSVCAPFYPRDAKLSTAPFYFLKATVQQLDERCCFAATVTEGRIAVSLDAGGDGGCRKLEDGFEYRVESSSEFREGDGVTEKKELGTVVRCHGLDGFELEGPNKIFLPFDLSESEEQSLNVLWTGWSEGAVLEVDGEPADFKYRSFFHSEEALADWARRNRHEIGEKCRFLDGLFREWSLGAATAHMSAMALHSFLANTWWAVRESGEDWFSVCDGSAGYHSAIDVEYNNALLYLNFWPELLDMLLSQWAGFEVEVSGKRQKGPKKASFLCHDMGAGHMVGRQVYPHSMEVEENCNYLLLMAARTFFTGDLQLLHRHLPLCRRLAAYIIDADCDGDGFPDTGTANTIDDAGAALQYSGGQTYLAVKAQAALWAMGELEELMAKRGSKSNSERWKVFAAKGIKTLQENGWIKDHYAVSIRRTTEGMVDPRSGEDLPEGELEGWDDYSIYTANGLLYLFMTNMKMPRWNHMRLAEDLQAAEKATRTPYGNAHASSSGCSVLFSQNLWRDYVAAYYGIDFLQKVEEYLDCQQMPDRRCGPAPYRDSSPENRGLFSPRGVTVFGAPVAAAGLRINRVEGEMHLAPVRRTLRAPLPALADWKAMRVPWVIAETRDGVTTVRITERDVLGGLKVHVVGAELEKT